MKDKNSLSFFLSFSAKHNQKSCENRLSWAMAHSQIDEI